MMQELSVKVAQLDERLQAFDKYEHERWHRLNNDLTPLIQLPERMTRELGKLHGIMDGKISTMQRDFERSIEAAIEKAIAPLRADVENLKLARQRWTGARVFGLWLLSTIIAIVAAVGLNHK